VKNLPRDTPADTDRRPPHQQVASSMFSNRAQPEPAGIRGTGPQILEDNGLVLPLTFVNSA